MNNKPGGAAINSTTLAVAAAAAFDLTNY